MSYYRRTQFIIPKCHFQTYEIEKSEQNGKSRKEFNFIHLMLRLLRSLDGTTCVRLVKSLLLVTKITHGRGFRVFEIMNSVLL
jgi:hypothetical protein